MRCWILGLFVLLAAWTLEAQEAVRDVKQDGVETKFLTHNQIDTWKARIQENETLIVHVSSLEFDPVLQLVRKDGSQVTDKIDDEGSESRLRVRLTEAGEYHVRVHAFQMRGGGNYRITFERLVSTPIEVAARTNGAFDAEGVAHHHFLAEEGAILVPDLRGTRSQVMRDAVGRILYGWENTIRVMATGEHTITLRGRGHGGYSLLIRRATIRDLGDAHEAAGALEDGALDVWGIDAEAGQFRRIEIRKQGRVMTRLGLAPETKDEKALLVERQPSSPVPFTLFPASTKGDAVRYFVLFNRSARFELALLARSDLTYRLLASDPTAALPLPGDAEGRIDVGGTAFYTIAAEAGGILHLAVDSEQFDPTVRLHDERGNLLLENDDGGNGLGSTLALLVKKSAQLRVQVSAVGNGGGGRFRIRGRQEAVPSLAIGDHGRGRLGEGADAYWSFAGQKGQTILVHARSLDVDVQAEVFGPEGTSLGTDDDSGVGTDSLMAIRLPASGRYILRVGSRRGAGAYAVQLIAADDS
ncbi:MAG: PPC domain-containing protein [Planctomycetes bacterium]|nr:PPC domain-containing protein [Planctomycetota bacterium]